MEEDQKAPEEPATQVEVADNTEPAVAQTQQANGDHPAQETAAVQEKPAEESPAQDAPADVTATQAEQQPIESTPVAESLAKEDAIGAQEEGPPGDVAPQTNAQPVAEASKQAKGALRDVHKKTSSITMASGNEKVPSTILEDAKEHDTTPKSGIPSVQTPAELVSIDQPLQGEPEQTKGGNPQSKPSMMDPIVEAGEERRQQTAAPLSLTEPLVRDTFTKQQTIASGKKSTLGTATFQEPQLQSQNTQRERPTRRDDTAPLPEVENIDKESTELIVVPVSIKKDLLLRLIQTDVLSVTAEQQSRIDGDGDTSELTQEQTTGYLNGQVLSRYMIFLKKYMKRYWNQIYSFSVLQLKELRTGFTSSDRVFNWDIIYAELDKISLNLTDQQLSDAKDGKQGAVDMAFQRIERYSKMITDPFSFLKFEQCTEEDKYNDGMNDSVLENTQEEMESDMMSLRQNTLISVISKKAGSITRRSQEKHKESQDGKSLRISQTTNEHHNLVDKSFESTIFNQNKAGYIKVADDFKQDIMKDPPGIQSLKAMSQVSMTNPILEDRNNAEPEPNSGFKASLPPLSPEPAKKKVTDKVDILALQASKDLNECESSLELILISLGRAFGMSPKQSAALLTNNNQYLITACIKGVKGGRFDPLLSWYETLLASRTVLVDLLSLEKEQLPASSPQTFGKVMAAIGCGFYSPHVDLASVTFTLFTELFTAFQDRRELLELALKWFLAQSPSPASDQQTPEDTAAALFQEEKDYCSQGEPGAAGGLRLSLYAIRQNAEVTRSAMLMINVVCQVPEQLFEVYAKEMRTQSKNALEYLDHIGEFLPLFAEMCPEKATESGLLDFWLDLCSREAENDAKIQSGEKVIAIALLAEMWLLFTDYIDEREEVTSSLVYVFKRTVSERIKSIRLSSIAYLFKVLEKLIAVKKKAALTVYRALIFSLVENPIDPTIREMYFANFASLFQGNAKIPIEWLAEPLLKQIHNQLAVTFHFKIFDFAFMLQILEHPKFQVDHGGLMVSLFTQLFFMDSSYASAASQVILAALRKLLSEELSEGGDLLTKSLETLVRQLFEQLLDLEPTSRASAITAMKRQQRQNALKAKQGAAMLGGRQSNLSIQYQSHQVTPGSTAGKPPLKARDLTAAKPPTGGAPLSKNSQKDMLRRLKKSLYITLLLQIQQIGNKAVNLGYFRDTLLEKTREFKGIYGYFNKGMMELLKYYGDADQLVVSLDLDPQAADQRSLELQFSQEVSTSFKGNSPYSNHKSGAKLAPGRNIADRISSQSRPSSNRPSAAKALLDHRQSTGEVAVAQSQDELETNAYANTALVPYQAKERQSKSLTKRRALEEIEKIKKAKKDREQKREQEQEKLRLASAKRKKRLRVEIEKRKQELGIANKSHLKLALVHKEGQDTQPVQPAVSGSFRTKQVAYIAIEEEEERDVAAVHDFMRKYQKLWRNIFAKYQNQGYKATSLTTPSFDSIQNKVASLTFAEVTKLLKDHGAYPGLISKEELSQMVRLVSQRSAADHRTELMSLTYPLFQTFLINVAVHCFSRPPQDLSSQPMVKSLQALVQTFEEATRKRNLSTLLYEDPDAVGPLPSKDRDFVRSLNAKLATNPDYPVPDGFTKVKERVPVFHYKVPDSVKPLLGEPKTIAVELLDGLLDKLFSIHVLEPVVALEEGYRAKPLVNRSVQRRRDSRQAEALNIIKRAEERDGPASRGTNRSNLPKIGSVTKIARINTLSDLPQVYQDEIKKVPEADKANMEECALVLEGIIGKVISEEEKDSIASGSIASSSKRARGSKDEEQTVQFEQRRLQEEKKLAAEKRQKERKRQERHRKLKEDLAKLKEEKKIKDDELAAKAKEEKKRKAAEEKRLAEVRRKRLEDQKMEFEAAKDQANEQDVEAARIAAEEEREREEQKKIEKRESYRRHQERLNNQLRQLSENRKVASLKEQQNAQREQQQRKQLKLLVNKQIKSSSVNKDREQAAELLAFMERPEVKEVFSTREKALNKYFKHYCKQGGADLGQDFQFRLANLHFNEFNKLGAQSKIVPVLITADTMKSTFRTVVKQFAAQKPKKQASSQADQPATEPENSNSSSQYMDFELFKKALVRIAVSGQEYLGGQTEEQRQRKAEAEDRKRLAEQRKKELLRARQEQKARFDAEARAELRQEFSQQGNDMDDTEAFDRWLTRQEAAGNGVAQRVAAKMAAAKTTAVKPADLQASPEAPKPKNLNSDLARDLDVNFITAETLRALFDFLSIEEGEEGERKLDSTLQALINNDLRRGSTIKRGMTRIDPAASQIVSTPATIKGSSKAPIAAVTEVEETKEDVAPTEATRMEAPLAQGTPARTTPSQESVAEAAPIEVAPTDAVQE